jgi:hypothetical protein
MNVDGLVAAGLVAFGVSFFAGMETAGDAPPTSRTQASVGTQRLDLGLAASLPDGVAASAEPAPAKKRSKPAKAKVKSKHKSRRKAAPKPSPAARATPVVVVAPRPRAVVPSVPAPAPAPAVTPRPTSTATPQHFDDRGAPTEGKFDDGGTNP